MRDSTARMPANLVQDLMKENAQLASFSVLLGVSTLLGFIGRPTEMGLAIVAGAIGLAFSNLDKIARFKGAGFEAEMKNQLEPIIEKEIEPLAQDSGRGMTGESYGLVGDEQKKVVTALLSPNYTWRYIGSLSSESGVNPEKVKETLDWLVENQLARVLKSNDGFYWALNGKGREVFGPYRNEDEV